jgi:hypothetical protein
MGISTCEMDIYYSRVLLHLFDIDTTSNTVNALCARDNQAATRMLFIRVHPHFHHEGTTMYDVPLAETHILLFTLLDNYWSGHS